MNRVKKRLTRMGYVPTPNPQNPTGFNGWYTKIYKGFMVQFDTNIYGHGNVFFIYSAYFNDEPDQYGACYIYKGWIRFRLLVLANKLYHLGK